MWIKSLLDDNNYCKYVSLIIFAGLSALISFFFRWWLIWKTGPKKCILHLFSEVILNILIETAHGITLIARYAMCRFKRNHGSTDFYSFQSQPENGNISCYVKSDARDSADMLQQISVFSDQLKKTLHWSWLKSIQQKLPEVILIDKGK